MRRSLACIALVLAACGRTGFGGGDAIELTVTNPGPGVVISLPEGIECGADCAMEPAAGSIVALTMRPEDGLRVALAGGGCAGTESCFVEMDSSKSVTASWLYRVEVVVSGPGMVTATNGAIACPPACTTFVPADSTVTLVATSSAMWSHAACPELTRECSLIARAPEKVNVDLYAPGSVLWVREFGGSGPDGVSGMAVHGSALVFAGPQVAPADFGGGLTTTGTTRDGYVAALSKRTGATAWVRSFVGASTAVDEIARTVQIARDGSIVVSGSHASGTIDFAGTVVTNPEVDADRFLARLTPAGALASVTASSGGVADGAWSLALTSDGRAAMAGFSTGNQRSIAVATSGGGPGFSRAFDGANNEEAYAVGVITGGDVVLGGYYQSADLTVDPIALPASSGLPDLWLSRLDGGSLTANWVRTIGIGNGAEDVVRGIAVDGQLTYAAGWFGSTGNNFGGGFTLSSQGDLDAYLMRVGAAGGTQMAVSFGSSRQDGATAVALLPGGDVVVAGYFGEAFTFGPFSFNDFDGETPSTRFDFFIARVRPDGTPAWVRVFGGTGSDFAFAVAADENGVYVGGQFEGTMLIDGTTLTSDGSSDMFVLRLTP